MILQRWPDSYKLLIELIPTSSRLVIEGGIEVEGLRRIVGDRGYRAEWKHAGNGKHLGGTKSLSICFEGLHVNSGAPTMPFNDQF